VSERRRYFLFLLCFSVGSLLSACGGGGAGGSALPASSSPGIVSPSTAPTGTAVSSTPTATPTPIIPTSKNIYVSNPELPNGNVVVFAGSASATDAPLRTLNTGLAGTGALALNSNGNLFEGGNVYAAGASGNAVPTSTYSNGANFVAIDSANNVYTTTFTSVVIFASNNLNVPISTISGSNTDLDNALPITIDQSGTIYVGISGTAFGPGIVVFAPGASGNAIPIRRIVGPATGLVQPESVALDSRGDLFVADGGNTFVLEFAPGANGNVTPISKLFAPNTFVPSGVAVDENDNVYIAFGGSGSRPNEIAILAPGAVSPSRVIFGASNALFFAGKIAIGP
jgi:hypothetical protein